MNRGAIYAGTFDPITLGHLDVITRASRIFDPLIVVVAQSTRKSPLFSLEERVAMVRETVENLHGVKVDSYTGLLVEYARSRDIAVMVRGLRAFSDFEVEFQMALTNRKMAPDIETVFLMPKEDYSYLSSSMVREVAAFGGNADEFVPPPVRSALRRKLTG